MINIWNEPTLEELAKIPPLSATKTISEGERMIYAHFFLYEWHWYIAEYNPETQVMFCYAYLSPDYKNWRNESYFKLRELNLGGVHVRRALNWKVVEFKDIHFPRFRIN